MGTATAAGVGDCVFPYFFTINSSKMKRSLLLASLVLAVGIAQAQFFKKIVDQVKQTAQSRANSKADNATNRTIDRVDGTSATSAGSQSSDTASAAAAMKMVNTLIGAGGVSKEDSVKAIQAYRSARGGSGVFLQMEMTMTGKMNRKDTSGIWVTDDGEGRAEMTILGSKKIITIGRLSMPTYSLSLNPESSTFALNIVDTSLLNMEDYKVEKLGAETVGGYPCTHVRVTSKIGKGIFSSKTTEELWVSTAMPGYSVLKSSVVAAGQQYGMMKAMHQAGVDGFFVKMSAAGKDYSMTMQLVQVKQTSFPASMFAIPSGYTESDEGVLTRLLPAAMGAGAKKP
jgi:hypothetical protein